jgi:uncharacterized protein (DUF362 family)
MSIRAAAEALGVTFPQGQSVLLHPACPWAHPCFAPFAFTNPAVIEGAALALAGNTLTIATNSLPGFPTRYSYRKAGYFKLAKRLGARIVAMDETPTETVELGTHAVVDKQAALPRLALKAAFAIALSKLTGSTFVSFAGAIRHHQSLLQHRAQVEGHHRLHTKMVDLLGAVPPDLIIVDAITATHKGGELSGQPVELGVLIVGTNLLAVDTICAVVYGLDTAGIEYLQMAADRGYGPADPSQIQIVGDLTLKELIERGRRVEHVDPRPENYPLPPQVTVMRSPQAELAGTAGGLTEVFLTLERGGVSLSKARETVIVIGQVSKVPPGKSNVATIIFLDDTARAEYRGYSRVVRLRGRYVPLSILLNKLPYAMNIASLGNLLGGEMTAAMFSSRVVRLVAYLTRGAGQPVAR